MTLTRRGLLATTALGLAATGCGRESEPTPVPAPSNANPQRIAYGDDPAQFGELSTPTDVAHGTVVVIHGGFWLDAYDLSLGRPLAADLVAAGWAVWNIEYRRVGSGGGVPQTLDDVHLALEKLADLDVPTTNLITVGHSAGGHLAVWAAGRAAYGWRSSVAVTAAVPQAGVLDLTTAAADGLGGGAVQNFVGGPPGPDYDRVDPIRQLPLDVPVRCVHGAADTVVPVSQSQSYVSQAQQAGGDAELIVVPGDHFAHLDVASETWRRTVAVLEALRSETS